ncbi:hypothetical protein PAPHI01_1931 [Pancytospora philotis]|nr:hypothetical protein PAPHI01_1931 [Pancytospora philotis]
MDHPSNGRRLGWLAGLLVLLQLLPMLRCDHIDDAESDGSPEYQSADFNDDASRAVGKCKLTGLAVRKDGTYGVPIIPRQLKIASSYNEPGLYVYEWLVYTTIDKKWRHMTDCIPLKQRQLDVPLAETPIFHPIDSFLLLGAWHILRIYNKDDPSKRMFSRLIYGGSDSIGDAIALPPVPPAKVDPYVIPHSAGTIMLLSFAVLVTVLIFGGIAYYYFCVRRTVKRRVPLLPTSTA